MSRIIDISHWNTITNWDLIKQNVNGVILKCGGTDSTNGKAYTDVHFEKNYIECKKRGIPVGAYWFVGNNCLGNARGVENALEFLKRLDGKAFSLPVFIDFETSTESKKRDNTDAVIGFCNTMESKGYFVGVYASDISGFKDRLYADELKGFCWWVAKYSNTNPSHNYNLWQYTSSGTIPGVNGRVDISIDKDNFIDKISKLIVERGFNGYKRQELRAKIQVEIYKDDYNYIARAYNEEGTFADMLNKFIEE